MYTYIYLYILRYTYIYVYIFIYILTYTYRYLYIPIYTYIYLHRLKSGFPRCARCSGPMHLSIVDGKLLEFLAVSIRHFAGFHCSF